MDSDSQAMEEVDEMIKSWMQDFNMGTIGKTELTTRLFNLEDPKIRAGVPIRVKADDNTKALHKIDLETKRKGSTEGKEKLVELLKAIEKRLSPSEKRSYNSLCNDFKFRRIAYSKFTRSLLPLLKKYKDLYQGFREIFYGDKESRQEDEVEETRDDQDMDIEENLISEPKIGTGLKIQERESLNVVDKKKKKRGKRPTKKQKTSKRYERVTPNYYRLIPEEEQSPSVSSTVLNNTCMLRKDVTFGGKELNDIEEEMKKYEDQMYETDMVVEALTSAVDRANKVLRGEMRFDDLGVKFYRCIEQMYGGDMFEIVREDYQKALPVILKRLNQKLLEVKATRESFKPVWKQAIEENYAKQRASIAQLPQGKMKKRTI